jgi:hypothetical protein
MAMVFNMVTGKRLFKETAKTLIKIKKDIKRGVEEKGRAKDVLRMPVGFSGLKHPMNSSRKQTNRKKLKYISMIMSPDSREMLLPVILDTHQLCGCSPSRSSS